MLQCIGSFSKDTLIKMEKIELHCTVFLFLVSEQVLPCIFMYRQVVLELPRERKKNIGPSCIPAKLGAGLWTKELV